MAGSHAVLAKLGEQLSELMVSQVHLQSFARSGKCKARTLPPKWSARRLSLSSTDSIAP